MKRLQYADCLVCLVWWKDRKNDGIGVRVEKGSKHSTCYTVAHDIAEYRICRDAITGQESFQIT
jgi:hypothetical protein